MNRLSSRPASLDALSVFLPTAEETLLLRACLSSDEPSQTWARWQRYRTDPNGFLGDCPSARKLRPLVYEAVRRYGLELDKESRTYLRSARLKEELRGNILRRVCGEVLQLFQKEDVPAIMLKGIALAETVYDNPALRHCHDIDLLLREQDLERAANLLRSLRFRDQESDSASDDYKLEHQSGVLLELHGCLFENGFKGSLEDTWARTEPRMLMAIPARILSPADNLSHVCVHGFYSPRRESLRWVSDAWFIIQRRRDLNWDLLLEYGDRTHLALPLAVTLGYLAEDLNAPVPSKILASLFTKATKSTTIERELALFRARTTSQETPVEFLRRTRNWRGKALLIRWMLFPSATYLSIAEGIRRSWLLPLHYLARPLRYLWYRSNSKLMSRARRLKWRMNRIFLRMSFRNT
jgi:Uncharacterised nucleotidyltransferase